MPNIATGVNGLILVAGPLASGDFPITRVKHVFDVAGVEKTVFEFVLTSPLLVPGGIVQVDGQGQHSLSSLANVAQSIRGRIEEAQRQWRNVEFRQQDMVTFLRQGGLPNGNWAVGGRLSMKLGGFGLSGDFALDVRAEFAVYARAVVAGTTREYTFAGIVDLDVAGPRIRIDFDEFNFSLPEFQLPNWNLDAIALPNLDGAVARSFAQLGQEVVVTVAHTNPDPAAQLTLKLEAPLAGDAINWGLVNDGAQAINPANLASFDVEITPQAGGAALTITNFKASSTTITGIVGGSFDLPSGAKRLGPLELVWDQMMLSGTNPPFRLQFPRVTLRDYHDPTTALTVEGEAEAQSVGMRLTKLRLVEPVSLNLLAPAVSQESAGSVLRVILKLAGVDVQSLLSKLLTVLGKLAAALARAESLLLSSVDAIIEAGSRLIAQFVGELVTLVDKLVASANALDLDLEFRIGTDPFELRQVIVLLKDKSTVWKVDSPGLSVQLPADCRPGLLLDFVSGPCAYLFSEVPDTLQPVELSTDLFLKSENAVRPIADADEKSGGRPQTRLITLEITKAAGVPFIMLAGLQRGAPVFLQELKGIFPAPGASIPGALVTLSDLPQDAFTGKVKFEKHRVLPLLGMGEPGNQAAPPPAGPIPGSGAAGPDFLNDLKNSLSNTVWVKEFDSKADLPRRTAELDIKLGVKAAGVETEVELKAKLDLKVFQLTFNAGNAFDIQSTRIEEKALGLTWVIEQVDEAERLSNAKIPMFKMSFNGAESGLELNKDKARMQLRYEALSGDGRGVVFDVAEFRIAADGVTIDATVTSSTVTLNGLGVPFEFTNGSLRVRKSRFERATIGGRGKLPPDLIGDADCEIVLALAEGPGGIVLESGTVELKTAESITCHSTRFTLTVSSLDLSFVNDGGIHFYFLVTGSLRFNPNGDELKAGLLRYLDGVEMNLERVPLSGDPRVLLKYISFQKALNPKKSFNLFNLFTMELRGFGFHPRSPKFDGQPPAVNLSGGIRFVEFGDVPETSIDHHCLWLARPNSNESLPRIKADGLGVDLNLKGAIKVRGTVLTVDKETRTLEPVNPLPENYVGQGFVGQGEFQIPGWGNLGASFGFLELEKKDAPGDRRIAFFLYGEKRRLAVEIPTPIWVFYLRQAGFGFGYRFTTDALRAADEAQSVPALVKALDEVSKTGGELHKLTAWKADPEGDRVTLALKGVMQTAPASKGAESEDAFKKQENATQNPFLFEIVAAIRSDFTLFMGLKGWIGANYIDYEKDEESMRGNPGLRGYLYISAPRQQLLARMIGSSQGYIGRRLPMLEKVDGQDPPMRRALRSVDWSATLFIKPGLFHYELGWPNQLSARLVSEPNIRVSVRGGMIFRAAEDGLLWAYNIEADAYFEFGGQASFGPLSLRARATLDVRLVARMVCYLARSLGESLFYGLISLHATLTVQVEASLRVFRWTRSVGFSVQLQLSAAVELALSPQGIGARVDARVAIQVFGRTLGIGIGFSFNDGQLDQARSKVQRFMALSITAEQPDAPPVAIAQNAQQSAQADAVLAETITKKEKAPKNEYEGTDLDQPVVLDRSGASGATDIGKTDFWLLLHRKPGTQDEAFGLLIPKEAEKPKKPKKPNVGEEWPGDPFYASPRVDGLTNYRLRNVPNQIERWTRNGEFAGVAADVDVEVSCLWGDLPQNAGANEAMSLRQLFEECFLSKVVATSTAAGTHFEISKRRNPPARFYEPRRHDEELDERARTVELDRAQRQNLAEANLQPEADEVHQARAFALTQLVEQFIAFAKAGGVKPPGHQGFHVTDLGLVFRGAATALEALDKQQQESNGKKAATITKIDENGEHQGTISVLNCRRTWYDVEPPKLSTLPGDIVEAGVRLDWDLEREIDRNLNREPETSLRCYEVERSIGIISRLSFDRTVKITSTPGAKAGDAIVLIRSDWQLVDDLADLTESQRLALLPPVDSTEARERAARAWQALFPDRDEVAITYTVVPIDIAGVSGKEQTFVAIARRPVADIPPVFAELRVVVRNINAQGPDLTRALSVYMAVSDSLADANAQQKQNYRYDLILDPAPVSPSGFYGSGALSERGQGGPRGNGSSADEVMVRIPAERFGDLREFGKLPRQTKIEAIEPDRETLTKFPRWAWLAGPRIALDPTPSGPNFDATHLKILWETANSRKSEVRAWVRLTRTGSTGEVHSARTPVSIEIQVEPQADSGRDLQVVRPEAFEWPVHLALPPHQPGQVDAYTGFAGSLMPPTEAIKDCDFNWMNKLDVIRDAKRRVMTTVRFGAGLLLDGKSTSQLAEPLQHIAPDCVAGYQVYELDLDALAPLDTGQGVGLDAPAWRRARRVAQVELVTPATGQLIPEGNQDWQGWAAHYPSEAWRLKPAQGSSRPIRAPWYSAAETTAMFPQRVARRRVFPTAPEDLIASLLEKGKLNNLAITGVDGAALTLIPANAISWFTAREELQIANGVITAGVSLDAALLRDALLRLCCDTDDKTLKLAFTASTGVEVKRDDVNRSGFHHPVLEEAIGLLSYHHENDLLYQRYVVNVQPVPAAEAKKFAEFMDATSAERDPYGWLALQQLGLAATIRLYDRDEDRFVAPVRLVELVSRALRESLRHYDTDSGQPFVDVLLKPQRDRVLVPHEAVAEGVELEPQALGLSDCGLAAVQISLRPSPKQMKSYFRVKHTWPSWQSGEDTRLTDGGKTVVAHGYLLENPGHDFEVISISDGKLTEVRAKVTTFVPIANGPGSGINCSATDPGFWIRGSADLTKKALKDNFAVDTFRHLVQATAPATAGLAYDKPVPHWNPVVEDPSPPLNVQDIESAYEQFKPIEATAWDSLIPASSAPIVQLSSNVIATLGFGLGEITEFWPKYIAWAQRFLDHGRAPRQDGVAYSIAAPQKANPLQLATERDEWLTVSLLHEDRWGAARAYAVRPVGRYQNLAVAAGCYESAAEAEQLVTPDLLTSQGLFANPIGCAIAVTPRTERLEAPVVLGAALVGNAWQVTWAQHGEEALKFANRTLAGRLLYESTAVAPVREYRFPGWPDRLIKEYKGLPPNPQIYPEVTPQYTTAPPQVALTTKDLANLANLYPSLWKGAKTMTIPAQPAAYRVILLSTALAGIVVSKVVPVALNEMPRKKLTEGTLGAPHWEVVKGAATRQVVVHWRLVSHRDVSVEESLLWLEGNNHIGYWPDPDVSYSVLRCAGSTATSYLEEEDATVRLMGSTSQGSKPLEVRARGNRFTAPDGPAVASSGATKPQFKCSVPLVLDQGRPLPVDRLVLDADEQGTDQQIADFNIVAPQVGKIVEHQITVTVTAVIDPAATNGEAINALNSLINHLSAAAGTEPELSRKFNADAEFYTAWQNQLSGLDALIQLSAADHVAIVVPRVAAVTLQNAIPALPSFIAFKVERYRFELHDIPTEAESEEWAKSGVPASQPGGPIRKLCLKRILGVADHFTIRAIDTQKQGSVVDTPLDTPEWLQ
jgi:hypothetical protein